MYAFLKIMKINGIKVKQKLLKYGNYKIILL
jgi:hypothetical protein